MTVVRNTIRDGAAGPVVGAVIQAALVGSGFLVDGSAQVVRSVSTVSGSDGSWSLNLTAQSLLEAPSYYVLREDGKVYTLTVPDAGPVNLRDCLVDPPAVGLQEVGLSKAAADALYAPIGSGGGGGGISQAYADAHYDALGLAALRLLKTANLSDLASATTARTNLGLGTAATQASTAFDAAGAAAAAQAASLQKASNLSDLASAATARTNLGLGTAATQASTAFDTAGAATAAVAAIPADPVAGTAGLRTLGAGAQQASAGNHTHGGGGGSAARVATARLTGGTVGGDVNPSTSGGWTVLTVPLSEVAISAAVGDYVEASARFLTGVSTSSFYELAVLVAGSVVWYGSSGTSTPSIEGDPSEYPPGSGTSFDGKSLAAGLIATAPMIDTDAKIHFVVAIKANGGGKTYGTANYPARWLAKNYGPPAP